MLNHLFITAEAINLIKAFLQSDIVTGKGLSGDFLEKVNSNPGHLSFDQWWELLEELNQALAIPALGLKIGEKVRVEHFGCLGYLLKSSENLEQALKAFERFQRLLYDGNKANLLFETNERGEKVATLVWQSEYGYSSQLSDELLLSGLITLARNILEKPDLAPVHIGFTNDVENALKPMYEQYFQCPVAFRAANLTVSFPANYFMLPIQGSDRHLYQIMSSQAEQLLKDVPGNNKAKNFVEQLRSALIRALQAGSPCVEEMAIHMNISPRTLHRRLKENNVLFRDLLKETRKHLAKKYLTEARMSLPEIALMLGYSEQSAFNRAFREWFGETPKQYQRQQ